MAFFVLNSDITIGSWRISGVNMVQIKRSLHSYGDSAVIKVPRKAREQKGKLRPDGTIQILPGTSTEVFPAKLFTDGTPVSIRLGYNGEIKEEFKGFVRRRSLTMPLEIECEGYIRQLRKDVNLKGYLEKTNVKELLEMACGIRDVKKNLLPKPLTDVTVVCQADVPIHKIQLINVNGQQIIDEVKKITQGTVAVFFLNPTTLWCGFTYTPYVDKNDPFGVGIVSYRLGFNCLKDNGLKERVVDEPVQVLFNSTLTTGQVIQTKSEADYAAKKAKSIFNNIQDISWMKKMANEKQYHLNYQGYEGHITGFLQPYCLPGYKANIVDTDYPERNGSYMIESTEVAFGVNGARRTVELGPLIGFDPKNLITK